MKLFRAFSIASLLTLLFAAPVFAAQTGTLLPISDGHYLQWTPKTGTSHFAMVDESSCNGNTDYNATTVVGNRDSYGISLSSVPDGSTITQIDLTPCASRNSAGGTNPIMNVFYRLNGVDSADAGNYSLSATTPTVLTTTSFTGLSTVKSPSTTLEDGAVLTSSTKGARLSQLAATITYTPLATPSGLTAVSTGSATINVSWTDNASNESGFQVERSTNGGGFVAIATTSANITTYADTGLSEGSYTYRVRAYNSGGTSGYTATATAYVITAPTSLSVVTASPSVTLTWVDNSASEDGFLIERRFASGGSFVQIKTVGPNVTTTQDTSNPPFGTWEYRVRAYKASSRSDYSNTASTNVLPPPFGLTAASMLGSSSINLSWSYFGSGETGFRIERSDTGAAGTFSEIGTVDASMTGYTDPNLTVGNTYYYRVRAYEGADTSDYSATASATVQ